MVVDANEQHPSQWAAIDSINGKIGRKAETGRGPALGVPA
jgi:hypothetical protein